MKSYITKFLCFLGVIYIVLSLGYSIGNTDYIYKNQVSAANQKTIIKEDFDNQINIKEAIKDLPKVSKPVTELPWDNDEAFLEAKNINNTHVLMGAYRTVLHNPLPGEEHNIDLATKILSGTIVKGGQTYSQNNTVGPYTASKGFKEGPSYTSGKLVKTFGGGVCKVASTVYNVAVLSNLPITQRHYHSMPVSYVPYGQDATVCYGARDLTFKNSKSSPIMIWSQSIGNTLYVGFYGSEESPKVEWNHEILSIKKAPTVYNKNPDLPSETKNVIVNGMDGKVVKSWIKIHHSDGKVETKNMGVSYYNPLPSIVEVDSEFKSK